MKPSMRLLLYLYPSAWRDRYGAELESLIEDCKPKPKDIADVVWQAAKLRIFSPAFLRIVMPCGLVGMFVGLAMSLKPPQFTSTAVMWFESRPASGPCGPQNILPAGLRGGSLRACDDPVYGTEPLARTWLQNVLDRPFLASTILNFDLYPVERKQMSMDQATQKMLENIRLVPLKKSEFTSQVFDLQFSYPNPHLAQRVSAALIAHGFERQIMKAWLPHMVPRELRLGVVTAPSLPNAPSGPSRFQRSVVGLALGLFCGVLLVWAMSRSRSIGKIASVVLLVGSLSAGAQTAGVASLTSGVEYPRFDVVSIREDHSIPDPVRNPLRFGATSDGYHLKGLPMSFVILQAFAPSNGGQAAYRLDQIKGLPDWVLDARYVIDAKISVADLPKWNNPALQPQMLRAMLQQMLAERFGVSIHRENKESAIYELTVAPTGPKFQQSHYSSLSEVRQDHPEAIVMLGGAISAPGSKPGQVMLFNSTIPQLCALLANLVRRPIDDKTGLVGTYDITYLMLPPPLPVPGAPPDESVDPQIFNVVQDQLGLHLKAARGSTEILVIDHIERPTAN